MATGASYQVRGVPGEAQVFARGTAAAPSILFGNPNALGGLNDGLYATTAPAIGISLDAASVAVFSTTGLALTGSLTSSSATAGVGYATGAGGTVTQQTNKTTPVTLNTVTGAITLAAESVGAGVEVTFTVNNSAVAATDAIIVNHASAGTAGAYLVGVSAVGAGSFSITVSNVSGGALDEQIVLRFAVIKAVSA